MGLDEGDLEKEISKKKLKERNPKYQWSID
jgi:hypothetical protein